jgi:hypothetical protein
MPGGATAVPKRHTCAAVIATYQTQFTPVGDQLGERRQTASCRMAMISQADAALRDQLSRAILDVARILATHVKNGEIPRAVTCAIWTALHQVALPCPSDDRLVPRLCAHCRRNWISSDEQCNCDEGPGTAPIPRPSVPLDV